MPLTKANKTSFKPGHKGGPGRPRGSKATPEERAASELTTTMIRRTIDRYWKMRVKDAEAELKRTGALSLGEMCVLRRLYKSSMTGDYAGIGPIIDRMIGRVPEIVGQDAEHPFKLIVEDYRDQEPKK